MATQHSGAFTDLGKVEDLYYTDPDNCKIEAIPVEYNTRFTNDFTSKSSGTSTFIIPPGNGLKHIVISLGYNAQSLATQIGNQADLFDGRVSERTHGSTAHGTYGTLHVTGKVLDLVPFWIDGIGIAGCYGLVDQRRH